MPEETSTTQPNASLKYLGFVVLVVVLAVGYFFLTMFTAKQETVAPEQTIGEAIRTGTLSRPPVSASTTIKALEKSSGFQVLISYADRGFEPKEVSIKPGDTVRFTNNSSGKLQVAFSGDALGEVIAPQQFWEATFSEKGERKYTNKLNASLIGVVKVQ